jgi:hypothetical protein
LVDGQGYRLLLENGNGIAEILRGARVRLDGFYRRKRWQGSSAKDEVVNPKLLGLLKSESIRAR